MTEFFKGSDRSLRSRIALSFAGMALVICTFFSATAFLAVELSEDKLVYERLIKDADELIERHQQNIGGSLWDDNFFVNEQIPEVYRQLSDGVHEVKIDGHETTVLIRRIGANTYAATSDTSDFELTEDAIFIAIIAGFIASILLAFGMGLLLSRRIVAPVTELARAVEQNEDCSQLPLVEQQNEVGLLARAFANRSRQMQQFLADEKLFTGDVSHELRTPLTIMLGAAELLEVRLRNEPDNLAVAQRITRIASEATERVSALLLLSQSPDALKGMQISLTHLVTREVDRYRQMLEDKPVQLRFTHGGEEVWATARSELAGIAIGNLIRNACQYTEQGVVQVTLASDRITVEDEGPGLPESVCARLFSRNVRGHGKEYVGSGLGLAIVKRVADHMGWSIAYEPRPSQGSRFTLQFLPVSSSAPATAKA